MPLAGRRQPEWSCLAAVVVCSVLSGCASETPYPASWQPASSDLSWCAATAGAFENLPVESVEEDEDVLLHGSEKRAYLTLSGIIFGERMLAVDVTHVSFEPTDEGGLRIVPWLGERALDTVRTIEPRDCEKDRWLVKSGWDFDGYMMASAAVWTAGAVLPAATQLYHELSVDGQGRLIVHTLLRTGGTLFYVFPFRSLEGDAWYAYRRHADRAAPAKDDAR